MTDAPSIRERRLWLALAVSAVMQLATMAVVAALVLSPERFLLPAADGAGAALGGRRVGRQLLAAGVSSAQGREALCGCIAQHDPAVTPAALPVLPLPAQL